MKDEIEQLLIDIRRIGPTYVPPTPKVLFGEFVDDEQVEQYYEALVGALKYAKKIHFKGRRT
jgi:Costars